MDQPRSRKCLEKSLDYLHLTQGLIQEAKATGIIFVFNRMRREGKLRNTHQAFVN